MMAIHLLRSIYESLPQTARTAVGSIARGFPVRVRYGSAFVDERARIARAHRSATDEQQIAETRFRCLLDAASRTEFWQRVLADSGIVDLREVSLDSVPQLPLLAKDQVRDAIELMIDPEARAASRKYVTTGGTTGRPLGVWIERDASTRDWAHVMDAWSAGGYGLDDKRVVLRGVRLGDGAARRIWRYEPLRRELYVSVFDLNAEHLPDVRNVIGKFGARYIHGYPSAMEVLGRSYRSAGDRVPQLDGLLAVSENLYPGQREYLEEMFGAPLYAFYGLTEKVAFAAECSERNGYHVHEIYGHIELVDDAGHPIVEPGIRGEIVATGLLSSCMPLIRYRTGDYASWMDGTCRCGRVGRRLSNIEGRWNREYLVTSQDSRVYMSALNVHSDVFDTVERFRIVQRIPGSAVVEVVPGPGHTDAASERIKTELDRKLSGLVDIEVISVSSLQVTERGKGVFIEQLIPGQEGGSA